MTDDRSARFFLFFSVVLHLLLFLGLNSFVPFTSTTTANKSLNLTLAMTPHKQVSVHQKAAQPSTQHIKPTLIPQITQIESPNVLTLATPSTPKAPQIAIALEDTANISNTPTNTDDDSKPIELPIQEPIFDAAFLNNSAPAYPAFAQRRGQQGMVLLRVKVSIEGKAEEVELNQSSGFKLLDEVAQDTVKKWRFVPAKRGNTHISAWVIVPVEFKLG